MNVPNLTNPLPKPCILDFFIKKISQKNSFVGVVAQKTIQGKFDTICFC
jgi:hypothetical protein